MHCCAQRGMIPKPFTETRECPMLRKMWLGKSDKSLENKDGRIGVMPTGS